MNVANTADVSNFMGNEMLEVQLAEGLLNRALAATVPFRLKMDWLCVSWNFCKLV